MSSSTPPHILTLPRELRDQIYDHLYQIIEFDITLRITRKRKLVTTTSLSNAPLLSILLVCTRFHDEYLQASCFRAMSATVCMGDYTRRTPRDLKNSVCYDKAISLINTATVHVQPQCPADRAWQSISDWQGINNLVTSLKSMAPKLSSVRVAFPPLPQLIRTPGLLPPINLLDVIEAESFDAENLLPKPSVSLAGLPISNMGEGFYSEYVPSEKYNGEYTCVKLYQIGVYTYGRDLAPMQLSEVENLPQQWPGYQVWKSLLAKMPSTRAAEFDRLSLDGWDWKENFGDSREMRGLLGAERDYGAESGDVAEGDDDGYDAGYDEAYDERFEEEFGEEFEGEFAHWFDEI